MAGEDTLEIDVNEAINMAVRLTRDNLIRQVPVKTGALRDSIQVSGGVKKNQLTINSDYLFYGKFVDQGTGPYATKKRLTWRPRPGRGRKGIRPRYWTTLEKSTRLEIKRIFERVIAQQIRVKLIRPLRFRL